MKAKLEGKIARINVNHQNSHVTFMLEGDKTIHQLSYGSHHRPKAEPALDLSQPGDQVIITYQKPPNGYAYGSLAIWDNQTLGAKASVPSDAL